MVDFNTLYTTTPHKRLIKVLPEVKLILSSNLKSENAMTFLKHLSIELLTEPDTSLNKILLMLCLLL